MAEHKGDPHAALLAAEERTALSVDELARVLQSSSRQLQSLARATALRQPSPPLEPFPAPPPPRRLSQPSSASPANQRTIDEMNRRLDAYRDALRGGAKPNSLAAHGLKARVREQESFLGQQFAGLSPDQQRQAMPAMQQMERRRKEVEEEELRRRKSLTDELQRERFGLTDLGKGFGMATASLKSFEALAAKANPSAIQNFQRSVDLFQARNFGGTAQSFQSAGELLQLIPGMGGPNRPPGEGRLSDNFLGGLFGHSQVTAINDLINQLTGRQPLRNQPDFGIRARTTGAAEYEMQLGNAALESSGQTLDMELLRQQMEESNIILGRIAENTRGFRGGPGFSD